MGRLRSCTATHYTVPPQENVECTPTPATPHEESNGLVRQTFPGVQVLKDSPREKMSAAVLIVLAAVDPSAFASSGAT